MTLVELNTVTFDSIVVLNVSVWVIVAIPGPVVVNGQVVGAVAVLVEEGSFAPGVCVCRVLDAVSGWITGDPLILL
jgi:hypothetical protein